MAHKFVDKEKKRDWKLSLLYYAGVASIVVVFTALIDLLSICSNIGGKIATIIALIGVICLLLMGKKYKRILDRFTNKELLSEIFNAWSIWGILIFIVEKMILGLIDKLSDMRSMIIAIALFAILICGGVFSTVVIVKKPEWKHNVDV